MKIWTIGHEQPHPLYFLERWIQKGPFGKIEGNLTF
jgi:hypothetical protein